MGAEAIISLIFGLLDRAAAYAAIVNKAKAEGRDVTEAEIDTAVAADDLARSQMVVAIAKRRAAGG